MSSSQTHSDDQWSERTPAEHQAKSPITVQ